MSSSPELIDSHAHLYGKRFREDIPGVLERASAAGVSHVVVPATEPGEFGEIVEIARLHPALRVALGVHPHSAAAVSDEQIEALPSSIESANAVAVGEIGLDYHYDFAPRERQIDVFRRQIAIARELDLPFVVHNRESDEDMLRILGEEQDGSLRFQLHCFSSDVEMLQRGLDLGGIVSFTGNVTFRNSRLDDVVRAVPEDRFMIETDSPYMTPEPNRGKRNEPSFVRDVAQRIAEIRQVPFERIADMTTTTARRFFRLAVFILLACVGPVTGVYGQTEPVETVDTTARTEPYDKLIGAGIHLTQTTFIIDRITSASAASLGYSISATPLLPLGIDRLGLDLIVTPITIGASPDSVTGSIIDSAVGQRPEFTNTHNCLDIFLRYHFKPKALVDFTASIGYSYIYNRYGVDEFVITQIRDTVSIGKIYEETLHGMGGGLGIIVNLETPYGTFVPSGSLMFSTGLGDRPLARLGEPFQLSHVRLTLTYFPPLAEWLGMEYGN